MIKNIIFDMGGVLIDYNPEKTLYGMFDKGPEGEREYPFPYTR